MPCRASRRPEIGIGWLFGLPLVALLALIIFLTAERMQRPPASAAAEIGTSEWERLLPERLERLAAAVRSLPLDLREVESQQRQDSRIRWTLHRYEAVIEPERRKAAEALLSNLQDVDPGVALDSRHAPGGVEVHVGLDGLLVHVIRFRWAPPGGGGRRVALAVGPLGEDLRLARDVVGSVDTGAVTVDPRMPFAAEAAELAGLFDREVIVDIRREPVPSPAELARHLEEMPRALAVLPPQEIPGEAAEALRVMASLRGLAWLEGGQAVDVIAVDPATPAQIQRELQSLATGEGDADAATLVILPPVEGLGRALEQVLPIWQQLHVRVVPPSALLRTPEAEPAAAETGSVEVQGE